MSSARRGAHSYEPLEDGDSPADPGPPSRDAHSVGAVGAVGLMIGETVGMGVMGLPHAVSRVGIVLGVFMCVFVAAVSAHSALLLAQLNSVYPTATSSTRRLGPIRKGCPCDNGGYHVLVVVVTGLLSYRRD